MVNMSVKNHVERLEAEIASLHDQNVEQREKIKRLRKQRDRAKGLLDRISPISGVRKGEGRGGRWVDERNKLFDEIEAESDE